jgi:hypothetical protein
MFIAIHSIIFDCQELLFACKVERRSQAYGRLPNAHVNNHLAGLLDDGKCRVRPMVIPDMLIEAGTQHQQYEFAGLHAKHIAATALR